MTRLCSQRNTHYSTSQPWETNVASKMQRNDGESLDDVKLIERASTRLRSCITIFSNLLIAGTWRLWLPASDSVTSSQFPRVPVLDALRHVPQEVDYVFLCLTLVGSWGMVSLFGRRFYRLSPTMFSVGAIGLMLWNQHRIQPWLYQMAMLSLVCSFVCSRTWLAFARWQLISVYAFSAWSKIDYTFVHTLGQQFLDSLVSPIPVDDLNGPTRAGLAIAFPIAEFVIAAGLCWPRTRKWAAIAGIVQHILLMKVLGPWGLNHHVGVLLWNAFFIAMLAVLFFGPSITLRLAETRAAWKWWLVAVLLLPLLEPAGIVDHWPAWQLYAPRNSRASLQILATEENVENIPQTLQKYLLGQQNELYRRVDLDAWSLESLGVPIYPQDRFQLGVALGFLERANLISSAKITVESPANRWSGRRSHTILRSSESFEDRARSYRLNALPSPK